jgi:hypothetical protein
VLRLEGLLGRVVALLHHPRRQCRRVAPRRWREHVGLLDTPLPALALTSAADSSRSGSRTYFEVASEFQVKSSPPGFVSRSSSEPLHSVRSPPRK